MTFADIALYIVSALVGGGLVTILLYPATKRKTDSEANKNAADAWATLVNQLAIRITKLEDALSAGGIKVTEQDTRIDELEQEVDDLRDWIKCQGLTPPPRKRKGNG